MEINLIKNYCPFILSGNTYSAHTRSKALCWTNEIQREVEMHLCPPEPHAPIGEKRGDCKDANICSDNTSQDLDNTCQWGENILRENTPIHQLMDSEYRIGTKGLALPRPWLGSSENVGNQQREPRRHHQSLQKRHWPRNGKAWEDIPPSVHRVITDLSGNSCHQMHTVDVTCVSAVCY